MSLTNSNSETQAQVSKGLDRARQAATRVTPMAKSTGASAAQGVQNARAWAAPRIGQGVRDARGWAAPRIEQAAHAVEEAVAPRVSGALIAAAHRVDPADTDGSAPRRRWLRLAGGITLLSALGGIIVTILRKRGASLPGEVVPDNEMATAEAEPAPDGAESTEQVMVEAEIGVNGKDPAS